MKIVRAFDIPLPAVIAEWDAGEEGTPSLYRVVMCAEEVEEGEPNLPLRGRSVVVEHHCRDAMGFERWYHVTGQEAEAVLAHLLVAAVGLAPDFTGWYWGRKPPGESEEEPGESGEEPGA